MHTYYLKALRDAVASLDNKQIDVLTFCTQWRAQKALYALLPARYEQVAEDLLTRLETGSLFAEESCSFSPSDLMENLHVWLDKAEKTLSANTR